MQKWVNDWQAQLLLPITTASESIRISRAMADRLEREMSAGDWIILTLRNGDDVEIVLADNIVHDPGGVYSEMTITRGEEDASTVTAWQAFAFPAGTTVDCHVTAQTMMDVHADLDAALKQSYAATANQLNASSGVWPGQILHYAMAVAAHAFSLAEHYPARTPPSDIWITKTTGYACALSFTPPAGTQVVFPGGAAPSWGTATIMHLHIDWLDAGMLVVGGTDKLIAVTWDVYD